MKVKVLIDCIEDLEKNLQKFIDDNELSWIDMIKFKQVATVDALVVTTILYNDRL